MPFTPGLFPHLIQAVIATIEAHADEVTALDQAIGDGDHVINLLRGLQALREHAAEIAVLDWVGAWQKIGMTVMASVGGASGSLYATLFLALAKNGKDQVLSLPVFAQTLRSAMDAVKQRGKSDIGEKTLLDVLVPVTLALNNGAGAATPLPELLDHVRVVAAEGAVATRDMLATKGRASFLGERSKGYVDAGAKTAELMIAAMVEVFKKNL